MDVLTKAAAVFAEADNATDGKLPAFSAVLIPDRLAHVKRVLDFDNNGETANTAYALRPTSIISTACYVTNSFHLLLLTSTTILQM